MGTSTGGTNALQLAATFPSDIEALVLMSPNIAINNDKAYLLNNHWGFQLAKIITGNDHITSSDDRDIFKAYWYHYYPLQATVQLQEMLETTMIKETFEKVKQPVLMLYYFKDQVQQEEQRDDRHRDGALEVALVELLPGRERHGPGDLGHGTAAAWFPVSWTGRTGPAPRDRTNSRRLDSRGRGP